MMRLLTTLAFILLSNLSVFAQGNPLVCNASAVPVTIRSQGLTEQVADIVILCTGGNVPGAGVSIPRVNFTILTSGVNIANTVIGGQQTTDALVFLDEPNPELQFPCTDPVNFCENFEGNPLGAGGQQNRNVFQGRYTAAQPQSSISFIGVPLRQPGNGQFLTLRFTNIRVAVPQLPAPTQIAAFLSVQNPPANLTLNNNSVVVADVLPGLSFAVRNAADTANGGPSFNVPAALNATVGATTQPTFRLRYSAGFPTAFKRRGPDTSAASPSAAGDNPFLGIGTNFELGFSSNLFPAANGLNLINNLVRRGTRLTAEFTGIPNGVSIFVATTVATTVGAPTGIARLFSNRPPSDPLFGSPTFPAPTVTIAGGVGMIPLIVTGGSATATWEVVDGFDDVSSIQFFSMPVVLSYGVEAAPGAATVSGFLSPFPSEPGGGSGIPSDRYPIFSSAARTIATAFTLMTPTMVTVNSGPLAPATRGTFYSTQLTGQGNGVLTFVATSPLPPGFTLGSGGTFSGTPTQSGNFTFSVNVFDSTGTSGTGNFSIQVVDPPPPPQPLLITSRVLPSGVVGSNFGPFQLSASGGTGSGVTYTVTGLPPGLSATSSGVISGVPVIDVSTSLGVTARDSGGESTTASVGLNILPRLTFTGNSDFTATQGRLFNGSLTARGGLSPYTYSLAQGSSLPSGLTLGGNGSITGTPTQAGITQFQAIVTDVGGRTAQRGFSIRVLPSNPEQCLVSALPTSLDFTVQRTTASQSKSVAITNNCGNPVTLNASVDLRRGTGWLEFSAGPVSAGPRAADDANEATSGTLTIPPGGAAALMVTVTPGALTTGAYFGVVQLSGPVNLGIPVAMSITTLASSLRLAPAGLTFSAVANGPNPPPQSFNVITEPIGGVSWSATGRTNSGGNWLSFTPANGSTSSANPGSATVTVSVNSSGLAPGEYFGQVSVNAPNTASGQSDVLVVLSVLPPNTPLSPTVSQSGFILADSTPEELTIFNSSANQITFDSSRFAPGFNRPWFTVDPPSGNVPSGGSTRVRIIGDTTGVPAGVHRGSLLLRFSDNSSTTINLAFISSGSTTARTAESFENTCVPTQLASVFLTIGPNFQFPVTFPRHLEVLVRDNCNQAVNQGQAQIDFRDCCGNSTPMNFNGGGRYSATWAPFAAGSPTVESRTVTSDGRLSVSESIAGTIGTPSVPQALPPVISTEKRVQNAASFAIEPLAQGSAISIFGENLASSTQALATPPFPSILLGTSVSLGGRLLPITFVSDKQINAQMPYGLDPNIVSLGLFVSRSGRTSVEQRVQLTDSSPGAFTVSTLRPNLGAILDENFRLVEPANPARRDRTVAIFATGFGGVSQNVIEGTPAPSAPLATTIANTQVTVGGVAAEVLFSGLAPQNAGLYQINIRVPAGAPAGNDVPVAIRVGSQQAPIIIMPVQ
jgi:uncharacterized protein (TIGR03437 family)